VRLPPFALERFFAEHEFAVRHLLCVSDCQSMSVGQLLDLEPGSRPEFEALSLGYTETPGSPALRELIAARYQGLTPENVLVHVGAQEAIFTFAMAALNPGDEVVVHMPCYQSLHQVAQSRGCTVRPWIAREDNAWRPDPDDLPGLMNARTRAVILNFPHNPTGACLDAPDMARVLEHVSRQGCLLFSDEVYRDLEYGPGQVPPPACQAYERAVSLGVLSKSLGLAGLRVGWAASPDNALLEAMASIKDYTTICASAPSEFLAGVALRQAPAILARQRALTLANLELLRAFMRRRADLLAWAEPTGGPICFPRLADGGDAQAFCARALEGCGVLLLPGGLYGPQWASHMRVGFGRESFAQGLAALDAWLG